MTVVARNPSRRLYFRGSTGRFAPTHPTDETRVHDPLLAGRRLAMRMIAWQAVATALAALAVTPFDARSALAVVSGGAAVTLGAALAAVLTYRGGVQPAGVVLVRWFAGVVGRWIIAGTLLVLALGTWRLPALPVLAGVVLALVAQVAGAMRRPTNSLRGSNLHGG